MYHELTKKSMARRRRTVVCSFVALLAVLAIAFFAYQGVHSQVREQGAVSVRDAIISSAEQCCAIEGSYPSSLSYLEKNYGLRVNHEDYIITYEAFAGNLSPSVVVIPR